MLNDGDGVVVEAEGDAASLDAFAASLRTDAPPLARVEAVTAEPLARPRRGAASRSRRAGRRRGAAAIPPDVATCDDCLRELFDPADRRYRYPFLNCTQCGPRFTIVRERAVRPRARRRWPASRCAPTAGASTRTRPTGASTPSRSRCPGVRAAALDAARGGGRAASRRGDPRRQGPRRLPPRLRRGATRTRSRGCARASSREEKPFARDDAPRPRRSARSRAEERALLALAGAADRAPARRAGARGRRVGRAGLAVARRDAPVHAAPPPARAPTSAARSC